MLSLAPVKMTLSSLGLDSNQTTPEISRSLIFVRFTTFEVRPASKPPSPASTMAPTRKPRAPAAQSIPRAEMAALCEKVWVEKDLLHASGIMTTLNAALKAQFPDLGAKVIADFTLPWIQSKCDEINNGMQKKKLEGSHGQVWPLAKIFKLVLPSAP